MERMGDGARGGGLPGALVALAVLVWAGACVGDTAEGGVVGREGQVRFRAPTDLAFSSVLAVGSTFSVAGEANGEGADPGGARRTDSDDGGGGGSEPGIAQPPGGQKRPGSGNPRSPWGPRDVQGGWSSPNGGRRQPAEGNLATQGRPVLYKQT